MARSRRSTNNLIIAARVESSEANTRIRELERNVRRLERTNQQSLRTGRRRFRQMRDDMTATSRAATSLRRTLLGLATIGTFTLIARGMRNAIRDITELDNAAQSLGLSFEQLQTLQVLGADFGASAENVIDVTRPVSYTHLTLPTIYSV